VGLATAAAGVAVGPPAPEQAARAAMAININSRGMVNLVTGFLFLALPGFARRLYF
jgi:uncharacterized protein with GYD domain